MITPNEARRMTEGILTWKQVEASIKRAAQQPYNNHSITAKITDSLRDQMKSLGYKVTEMGYEQTYHIKW